MDNDDQFAFTLYTDDDDTPLQEPTTQIEEPTRLLEIFSVIYLGHDELTPDKQLGTIKVNDHLNVHSLYNVDKVDMSRPSIQHGDQIMLTAPTILPMFGKLPEVYLDLFDGNYKDLMHFIRGFDCYPLTKVIKSKDGTGEICILYSILEDVVSASVEFTLTNINCTTQVYGVVAASTSKIEDPKFTSILFLNKPQYTIELGPGDRIPLSRSIVAVPLDSHLFLDVHLRDDKDNEVVKGSLVFSAQSGTSHSSKKIIGKKGQIEVNVIWNSAVLTRAEKDTRDNNMINSRMRFL